MSAIPSDKPLDFYANATTKDLRGTLLQIVNTYTFTRLKIDAIKNRHLGIQQNNLSQDSLRDFNNILSLNSAPPPSIKDQIIEKACALSEWAFSIIQKEVPRLNEQTTFNSDDRELVAALENTVAQITNFSNMLDTYDQLTPSSPIQDTLFRFSEDHDL